MKTIFIIPTYNAERTLKKNIESILSQSVPPTKLYIIDSSSKDSTIEIVKGYNIDYKIIPQASFNHGLTRAEALQSNLEEESYDFAIYATQDIELSTKDSLELLLEAFKDKDVAIAYGRQLTNSSSSLLERYSRRFNYPEESIIKDKSLIPSLGLNTPFCSDSFAAYRVKDLLSIGSFPRTNFAEDMLAAARLILNGKKVAYVASAACYHSHPYSLKAEYARGREIAHMHRENSWLLESFGKAEKRGVALLKSVPFILKPIVLAQAMPKYIGYKVNK